MSEIIESDGQVSRYRNGRRLDKPKGLLSGHHTRRLDTMRAVLGEQARIYRSVINGLISTAEGARLVYMLREIRGTQEAIVAGDAAAAANAQANAVPPPVAINIIAIPEGFQHQPDGSFQPAPEAMRQIEHTPLVDDKFANATIEELKRMAGIDVDQK